MSTKRKIRRRKARRYIVRRIVIIRRPIRKIIVKRPIRRIIVKRPIKRIIIKRIIRRRHIIVKRVTRPRLPRVRILFADTYDEAFHSAKEKRWTHTAMISGRRFARLLRKAVKPNLKRFLTIAEEVSGLQWRVPIMRCYVVHDVPFDFDDPVTITIRPPAKIRVAVETLFHELTHQLVNQNQSRLHKRNYVAKKYAGESKDAKDHILDQAIMWKIYEKIYGTKETRRIITAYWPWEGHWRAWQIIRKEKPDRILKAYIKR